MFHWQDDVFFGRRSDGAVRILKVKMTPVEFPNVEGDYPDALFDVTIDPDSWASIIASVSAGNELFNRFYAAEKFHASVGEIDIVSVKREAA